MPVRLTIQVPPDFDFCSAVCSHGFFMLAPNVWDPAARTLRTAIALDDDQAAFVRIAESAGSVAIRAEGVTSADTGRIRAAVHRMLRLDEDFSAFHAMCAASETHRPAARLRFGRLLRSATLFEDMVKVICTCNIGWPQTVAIVRRLVERWGVPAPAAAGGDGMRAFPTPARLARVGAEALRRDARLGYRAPFVDRLARDSAEGRLDLDAIEREGAQGSESLFRRLRGIHGIGPYAAGNLCMLLGHYERLAVDTEMVRHLRQRYPRRRFTPTSIHRHYARWAPYQFLAYWFELWQGYIERHGDSATWDPAGVGRRITRETRDG